MHMELSETSIAPVALLPSVQARLEKPYPEVRMSVREMQAVDFYANVRLGDANFGVPLGPESSEFDFETLSTEDIFAFMPASMRDGAFQLFTG